MIWTLTNQRQVFKFCRSLTLVTWHVFIKLRLYTWLYHNLVGTVWSSKFIKNKLLSPLSELLFQKCIMLEIRYELVMVNSSNLAFSNSLLRFMNKIPMSGLAITLRTHVLLPRNWVASEAKDFCSTSAEKQSHHKLPYLPTSYLGYMYVLHAGYTYY